MPNEKKTEKRYEKKERILQMKQNGQKWPIERCASSVEKTNQTTSVTYILLNHRLVWNGKTPNSR